MAIETVSVVNAATRVVTNIVLVDTAMQPPWSPPAGFMIGPAGGNIGDTLNADGATYTEPAATPTTTDQLTIAAASKWQSVIDNGTVTAGGFQSSTSEKWSNWVNCAIGYLQTPGAPATVPWNGNVATPITLAQLQVVFAAIGAFGQAAFVTWQQVGAAIAAGTITTPEQIGTPPAPIQAWPASS